MISDKSSSSSKIDAPKNLYPKIQTQAKIRLNRGKQLGIFVFYSICHNHPQPNETFKDTQIIEHEVVPKLWVSNISTLFVTHGQLYTELLRC